MPLAAPLRVFEEEVASEEGFLMSGTKDGDDMVSNSATLVCEGQEGSVD
jgi:hypothetical protein